MKRNTSFLCLVKKVSISICVLATWSNSAIGQNDVRQADLYYQSRQFEKAASIYAVEAQKNPKDHHLSYRWAATLFELNRLDQSIEILKAVAKATKRAPAKVYYLMAQTYHHQHQYGKAIVNYKRYLSAGLQKKSDRLRAIHNIERCASGMKYDYRRNDVFVENMGAAVNTPYDEIRPVESPNYDSRIYFSSLQAHPDVDAEANVGEHNFDMYSTEIINGAWSEAFSLNDRLNTAQHEFLQHFSEDGMVAFFARGTGLQSMALYVDTFSLENNSSSGTLRTVPIDPPDLIQGIYYYSDSLLIYSSDRPGGSGGYDLYYCLQRNGQWLGPINFGETINSSFDEVSPYLAKDGRTLFFSTNNLKSMGGFDVFQSTFDDKILNWSEPTNIGTAINSAGDDLYYLPSKNGFMAYFSSDRKSGQGGYDIYTAYYQVRQSAHLTKSVPPLFYDVEGFRLFSESLIEVDPRTNTVEAFSRFTIPTLLYKNDQVLAPQNLTKLKTITGLLKTYPHLNLEIVCHSDQKTVSNFDLFFSILRAEEVQEYLISSGIKATSIYMKGLGGNYPLVKNELEGKINPTAKFYNRRIDLRIHNGRQLPLEIIYDQPQVSDAMSDEAATSYYQMVTGLSYRVQFAVTDQLFKGDVIGKYADPCVEKNPGSTDYFYCSGIFSSFEGALQHLTSIKEEGLQANIIAYMDGLRLAAGQIDEKLLASYPDLSNYSMYLK